MLAKFHIGVGAPVIKALSVGSVTDRFDVVTVETDRFKPTNRAHATINPSAES